MSGPAVVRLAESPGRYALEWGEGRVLEPLDCAVTWDGVPRGMSSARRVTVRRSGVDIEFDSLHLRIDVEETDGGVLLRSVLRNISDTDVRIESVSPIIFDGDWSAGGPCLFSRDALLCSTPAERHYGYDGDEELARNRPRVSCWWFSVHDAARGANFLCGVDGPTDGFARFDCVPLQSHTSGLRVLRWRADLDVTSGPRGVRLAPGNELRPGDLYLAAWNGRRDEGLATYAARLARHRAGRPLPSLPRGWCSWYAGYETAISERACLENLAAAAQVPGLRLFQIDDGWMDARGLRRLGTPGVDHDKFPRGMAALAADIDAAGCDAGLWLRPFQPWEPDAGRPAWADGDALDLSDPACLAWLAESVRCVTEDWGYSYLKLDFLTYDVYGAWGMELLRPLRARAVFRNDTRTTLRHLRVALETIQAAAGPSVYLLGCNALFGPAIGIFDGMRIGDDVSAWNWDRTVTMGARAVAPVLFLHGRLWHNDADCLLFHEPLTPAQIRTWNSFAALASQVSVMSSVLPALDNTRRAVLEAVFPAADPEPGGVTIHWTDGTCVLRRSLRDGGEILGLFNWTEETRHVELDSAIHRYDPAVTWREFWSRGEVAALPRMRIELEPCSCALFYPSRPGIQDTTLRNIVEGNA